MSDSYLVTPSIFGNPPSGNATIQYNSTNLRSNVTYSIKTQAGTTLTTSAINLSDTSFSTGLQYTGSVIATSDGKIYAQSGSSHVVGIYNFAGTSLSSFTAPDQYFDMCLDAANNKIYGAGVSSFGVINLSTNAVTTYSSAWLNGVALGPDGFAYATTNSGYRIQKINVTNGTQTNIFTSSAGNITSEAYGTFGTCTFDTNGFLYCITRGTGGYVYKFDTSGTLLGLFATVNSAYGNTFVIKCDTTTNNLYVTTVGSPAAIYKITPAGVVSLYKNTISTSSYGGFYDTVTGNLIITDYNKVYTFPINSVATTISFQFAASNLSSGSNVLQIYDSSGNSFGMPITISVPCFLEGTLIQCLADNLTDEVYIPVERLTKSTYVKTLKSGYVQVHSIGYTDIFNPNEATEIDNRLFKYNSDDERMPELFSDLYITGNHCALVETFSQEIYDQVVKHMGAVYATEDMLRLPACLDSRATAFMEPGTYRIWHFALNNTDIYVNYGVYANGLLVESSSIRYMTELSKMTLLE